MSAFYVSRGKILILKPYILLTLILHPHTAKKHTGLSNYLTSNQIFLSIIICCGMKLYFTRFDERTPMEQNLTNIWRGRDVDSFLRYFYVDLYKFQISCTTSYNIQRLVSAYYVVHIQNGSSHFKKTDSIYLFTLLSVKFCC